MANASVVLSQSFFRDLEQTLRKPSAELQFVKKRWPKVKSLLKREQEKLPRIPSDDPLNERADLLSPLGAEADEVLHTRALAYLLDPLRPHGFGTSILAAVVQSLIGLPHVRQRQLTGILRLLRFSHRNGEVAVIPEYRHLVKETTERRFPRTDIWIELRAGKSFRLIVIENKVRARESDQQLKSYEGVASDWRKKHRSGRPLLIFLTPDGRETESGSHGKWVSLPYLKLAAVLRLVWMKQKQAPGNLWLRLYLASALRQVGGRQTGGTRELDFLKSYLGKAT